MTELNFDRAQLSDQDVTFIATFLRFEFALKEHGFCRANGEANVKWHRVIGALGPGFYARIKEAGKAKTILSRPPKKQIARDHVLDWRKHDRTRSTQDIIMQ
jgi:hypothetical protein